MTKSFFRDEGKSIRHMDQIFDGYYEKGTSYHPYQSLIYEIAMNCVDIETNLLNFNDMYKKIENHYKMGIIREDTFEKFCHLGWETEMKFLFHIPTVSQWEKWINSAGLAIHGKEYAKDLYSKDFPIYILRNAINSGR